MNIRYIVFDRSQIVFSWGKCQRVIETILVGGVSLSFSVVKNPERTDGRTATGGAKGPQLIFLQIVGQAWRLT